MDSLALQNSGKGRKHFLKSPDFSATSPKPLASLTAFCFLTLSPPPLSSFLSLHSKMRKGHPVQVSPPHSSVLLQPTAKKSLLNLSSYYCFHQSTGDVFQSIEKGLLFSLFGTWNSSPPQQSSLLHPQWHGQISTDGLTLWFYACPFVPSLPFPVMSSCLLSHWEKKSLLREKIKVFCIQNYKLLSVLPNNNPPPPSPLSLISGQIFHEKKIWFEYKSIGDHWFLAPRLKNKWESCSLKTITAEHLRTQSE